MERLNHLTIDDLALISLTFSQIGAFPHPQAELSILKSQAKDKRKVKIKFYLQMEAIS